MIGVPWKNYPTQPEKLFVEKKSHQYLGDGVSRKLSGHRKENFLLGKSLETFSIFFHRLVDSLRCHKTDSGSRNLTPCGGDAQRRNYRLLGVIIMKLHYYHRPFKVAESFNPQHLIRLSWDMFKVIVWGGIKVLLI